MKVRAICEKDIEELRRIWYCHYRDEFDFPEFTKFNCGYIIEDDDEKIITAGGIRMIAESVLVTDKDKSKFTRFRALQLALEMNKYFCKEAGFDQMHAFVQDPIWEEHLIRHGFTFTKGKALVHWSE